MLPQSPRAFGKPTRIWTLELAAEGSLAAGRTHERLSDETIRTAVKRFRVRGKRAQHSITSPDPAYARKRGRATG